MPGPRQARARHTAWSGLIPVRLWPLGLVCVWRRESGHRRTRKLLAGRQCSARRGGRAGCVTGCGSSARPLRGSWWSLGGSAPAPQMALSPQRWLTSEPGHQEAWKLRARRRGDLQAGGPRGRDSELFGAEAVPLCAITSPLPSDVWGPCGPRILRADGRLLPGLDLGQEHPGHTEHGSHRSRPGPARPGRWKPQGECAGDTERPRPECTQRLGCLLWADVLLWPAGPASHPAPRVSGQGPHALQARVLVPAQRPMPDSQAGLDRCAPAYTGAVGLSPPSTQSPVPREHTSNGSVGGELRLDCTEVGCDVHWECHEAF